MALDASIAEGTAITTAIKMHCRKDVYGCKRDWVRGIIDHGLSLFFYDYSDEKSDATCACTEEAS